MDEILTNAAINAILKEKKKGLILFVPAINVLVARLIIFVINIMPVRFAKCVQTTAPIFHFRIISKAL